ncbi:hypothetical protein ZEAMMB73_Zm00001d033524 [Zea mays]|uniref:Uncharacterized protein n=1 Tax=Zea mays TaxID=4577 RepID=A0A1D6KZG1_MAIZE|nr:hypothetical protein ZEAMMB73_Zm00001d033524 [Zea mays]
MRTAASALHASRRICRRSTTMRPTTMRATNSYAGSGLPVLIPVAQQPCARQALDLPPPFAIQIQAESRLRCRCGTCEQTAVLAYAPLDSCLFTTAITTSDERYNWPVPWPERLDVSYASVPDDSASNKEKFEADTKYWKQLISELCRAYVDKAGCCLSIMLAWAEAISGAPGVQPLLCPQGGPLLRKEVIGGDRKHQSRLDENKGSIILNFTNLCAMWNYANVQWPHSVGCLSCLQRSALVQCTIQRGSFIQALQLHNKGPDSYLFEKGRRSILTQPLQYSKHDWRLHDMCPISLDKPDIHKKVEQEELEKLARKAQLLPWVAWVGITMLLEKGADVNARNYCGQVTRADYLSGRTSLHFATHDGFVRCIRLLVADFVPSVALEDIASSVVDGGDCQTNSGSSPNSSSGQKFNESYVLSMNLILLFETITI